jgi:hypothetical protein
VGQLAADNKTFWVYLAKDEAVIRKHSISADSRDWHGDG